VEHFGVNIRQVTAADIEDVLRIARAIQLSSTTDTRRGFLVSALSREVYAATLAYTERRENAEHVVFLVAEHNGKAIGFLFGYNDVYASRRSGGQSEADIAARYSGPFYVLKQIALDLNEHHKGVGRALVDRFVAEARCTYIFSAVVSEPENPASSMFHRKMGFAPIFNSTSSNVNGVTHPNQVWRRTCSPV
jgi:predicted GNAT superfamily acetyltransferase